MDRGGHHRPTCRVCGPVQGRAPDPPGVAGTVHPPPTAGVPDEVSQHEASQLAVVLILIEPSELLIKVFAVTVPVQLVGL